MSASENAYQSHRSYIFQNGITMKFKPLEGRNQPIVKDERVLSMI